MLSFNNRYLDAEAYCLWNLIKEDSVYGRQEAYYAADVVVRENDGQRFEPHMIDVNWHERFVVSEPVVVEKIRNILRRYLKLIEIGGNNAR